MSTQTRDVVACSERLQKGAYRSLKAISLQCGADIFGTIHTVFIRPVYLCITILSIQNVIIISMRLQRNQKSPQQHLEGNMAMSVVVIL